MRPRAELQMGEISKFVRAVHPEWSGTLWITENDVTHVESGERGGVQRLEKGIIVKWTNYPTETFCWSGPILLSTKLRADIQLTHLFKAKIKDSEVSVRSVIVSVPDLEVEVRLRVGDTDFEVFDQIISRKELESIHLPEDPQFIIDLGANIGLSSAFFATKYPTAHIIALEPDADNFALLVENTAAFSGCVECVNAAAWSSDGHVALNRTDERGQALGSWGIQVAEGAIADVRSIRIDSLLHEYRWPRIDILKIDIEGAEKALFEGQPRGWLEKVRFIMVETHERFCPGSERVVHEVLSSAFSFIGQSGEYLLFRKQL
jgi:FkbM family methyltransferase